MDFSTASLAKVRDFASRASARMTKLREHTETAIEKGVATVEVAAASGAFGFINARYGEKTGPHAGQYIVAGMPASLIAGIGLNVVAFGGGLGKYDEHGHNLGNGALAAYTYGLGAQFGADARAKAEGAPSKDKVSGSLGGGVDAWRKYYENAANPAVPQAA